MTWGSWEAALREITDLGAKTEAEQPQGHGCLLLTGVSRLLGCPPCCATAVPLAAQPSPPAEGHGNASLCPAAPAATGGPLLASVSPRSTVGLMLLTPLRGPRSPGDEKRSVHPPMLFRVTLTLILYCIIGSRCPPPVPVGIPPLAWGRDSAAARGQRRPARRPAPRRGHWEHWEHWFWGAGGLPRGFVAAVECAWF